MGGMRLFGRRCSIATDDFFFIGLIDFIVFLPCLGWIPVIYAGFLKQRTTCDEEVLLLLDISLTGLCLLFLLNWIVSMLFIIYGAKGTISKPEPRQPVENVVYAKLFVSVLDVAWASLGTVILFQNSYCDIFGVELVIKACTIFQWVATIVRMLLMIFFYDWKHSKHSKDSVMKEHFTTPLRKGTLKKCSLRIQAFFLLCTTPTEERKQALRTASELLALLSCDLDLVVSDLIAGLLIIRRKNMKQYRIERKARDNLPPISLSDGQKLDQFPPPFVDPWMNLKEALHFFKLGMGVYGWYWFVFKNLSCGCCLLLKRLTCCFPFRKKATIVKGDNCCGCSTAGLQLSTNLVYEDLVIASFKDSAYKVPFFVTFDHDTGSVLLTVRGTMSMDDILTDVSAEFAVMDEPGLPPGSVCHAGILRTARKIKAILEDNNVLEEAFRKRPGYRLVLTGHSLGAAVASVLTLIYKHMYNDVHCFAFAPCPAVNKAVLPYAEKSIFTMFYGNDVVGCITYQHVKELVLEIMDCLRECNLPKYKIFFGKQEELKDLEKAPDHSSVTNDEASTIEATSSLNGNGNNQSSRNKNPVHPVVTETCCLAGTIVHIYRRKDGYRLKITTHDDYSKILFRPRMILDHVPIFIEKALEDLSKSDILEDTMVKFS